MIEQALSFIEHTAVTYGAIGVFLAIFIQEIISFIPSIPIIMFVGFFVMNGAPIDGVSITKLFLSVALPVTLGLTLGSLFVYGIIYWLGKPSIEKFGKYLRISWEDVEKIRAYMRGGKIDEVVLFLARSAPIVPFSVGSAFCGLVRWNFWSYLIITFLGGFVRASILGFVGWQLGSFYKDYLSLFNQLENLSVSIIVLCLGAFLLYRRYRRKKILDINIT